MTKNTHLNHPEDEILTGNLAVLDCLYAKDSKVSLKIDGSPAIVWGLNPDTEQFFVGTKSVFNKKKIMIAHNHAEIDQFYTGNVARILHACFDYLPYTDRIIQGDFIGFGDTNVFNPNTLTYTFPETITEQIVVAPHTEYITSVYLRDAEVIDYEEEVESTADCKFLHPIVDRQQIVGTVPNIDHDQFEFLSKNQAAEVCKVINRRIADGLELTDEFLCDLLGYKLGNLYQMVIEIKEDAMSQMITYCEAKASFNGESCGHEGFVLTNQFGMIKLVNRPEFAARNFNRVRG